MATQRSADTVFSPAAERPVSRSITQFGQLVEWTRCARNSDNHQRYVASGKERFCSRGSADPLPTKLAGVQAIFDGAALPLLSVSPTEVRTQLPYGSGGDNFGQPVSSN